MRSFINAHMEQERLSGAPPLSSSRLADSGTANGSHPEVNDALKWQQPSDPSSLSSTERMTQNNLSVIAAKQTTLAANQATHAKLLEKIIDTVATMQKGAVSKDSTTKTRAAAEFDGRMAMFEGDNRELLGQILESWISRGHLPGYAIPYSSKFVAHGFAGHFCGYVLLWLQTQDPNCTHRATKALCQIFQEIKLGEAGDVYTLICKTLMPPEGSKRKRTEDDEGEKEKEKAKAIKREQEDQ